MKNVNHRNVQTFWTDLHYYKIIYYIAFYKAILLFRIFTRFAWVSDYEFIRLYG